MASFADEAEARKARSIATLKAEGVPYITHLPVIETEAESIRRSQDAVVERAIALTIIAVLGETRDRALVEDVVAQFGSEEFFSPAERAFLSDPAPDQQTYVQFTWRYEAAFVMLWALGFYDDVGRPDRIVDVGQMANLLRTEGTDGLRASARLRPQAEILDAADLIYRYHWATVDARVNGREIPDWMEPGVIYERHYALNWLIGYGNQPWDEISTDT